MKKIRLAIKVTTITLNLVILAMALPVLLINNPEQFEPLLDRPLLLGVLTSIITLLAILGLGQNYKLDKVLKTIAVLLNAGYLWWFEIGVHVMASYALINSPQEFFACWRIILRAFVLNIIAIVMFVMFDLASRLKALFKGKNPHIVAAYVFAAILIVLLTVFVIKM